MLGSSQLVQIPPTHKHTQTQPSTPPKKFVGGGRISRHRKTTGTMPSNSQHAAVRLLAAVWLLSLAPLAVADAFGATAFAGAAAPAATTANTGALEDDTGADDEEGGAPPPPPHGCEGCTRPPLARALSEPCYARATYQALQHVQHTTRAACNAPVPVTINLCAADACACAWQGATRSRAKKASARTVRQTCAPCMWGMTLIRRRRRRHHLPHRHHRHHRGRHPHRQSRLHRRRPRRTPPYPSHLRRHCRPHRHPHRRRRRHRTCPSPPLSSPPSLESSYPLQLS